MVIYLQERILGVDSKPGITARGELSDWRVADVMMSLPAGDSNSLNRGFQARQPTADAVDEVRLEVCSQSEIPKFTVRPH